MARPGSKIIIKKKKVAGGGGHHGGSWKVAYADFVTAMMAFFMVMWILGMDDKTKQAVEGYFANPVGYKKGYGAGSSSARRGGGSLHARHERGCISLHRVQAYAAGCMGVCILVTRCSLRTSSRLS